MPKTVPIIASILLIAGGIPLVQQSPKAFLVAFTLGVVMACALFYRDK